jgi:cephalosporin hydroxylase
MDIADFHRLYYHTPARTWGNTYYKGHRILKCPLDLWVYSEIIWEVKPDLIIETGTMFGGSALWLGDQLDLIGKGRVISIDIEDKGQPEHPRVRYRVDSSTSKATTQIASYFAKDKAVLVILDSDHSQEHVAAELEIYKNLVTPGSYLIVEDTNVNGNPVAADHGPGPKEAVEEFLYANPNFTRDESREKFYLTFNPGGYLRKS